jgi:transcriptional regulator with XRE-family HTH domain
MARTAAASWPRRESDLQTRTKRNAGGITGWVGSGARFGDLVRSYRSKACLTQEEVAFRSGLSVRSISDMERGRTTRPLSRSVRLLADALELDPQARAGLVAAAHGGTSQAGLPSAGPGGDLTQHPQPLVPRQLPAPVRHFAGRSVELARLSGLLDQPPGGGVAAICAMAGTAGIGKTALAVHWAHQVADRFPDGQLFVNLRGFGHCGAPTKPDEAVCGLLGALDMRPEEIPASPDARTALYRSLLATRRMLLVLDNAADERQVRPLLPGGRENLVIVTSRSQLIGLVAIEGASPLSLDSLSTADARRLLAGRLGPARLAREPQAAADLIDLCARLPLALAVAAARAAICPAGLLATLVAELRDAQRQVEAPHDTDPDARTRAAQHWAHQHLCEPAAREDAPS